ncbi:alpha/beta hydrolase family protein [Rhizobium laguerreae]|uniref:Alpha/beta hydrolase family protein n=1 Tax=Rhizobium laguerreae TaxID=1076926 RepID=A0AAX2QM40_9HYPH|nr:alpha/beta hydrolase family protein [Rhizobium laguerreae]
MNNPLSGTQAAGEPALSIVPVHGAFVDGSGWRQVHSELVDRGFEVLVAQHPTTSLEGDVAATERLIASARHPVLLVGHSYGGAVITEAGANPKVKSLAYIAAFVPDVGESVAALNEAPEEPGETKAPLLAPQDGYLVVDPVRFPEAFAADVDPATTRSWRRRSYPGVSRRSLRPSRMPHGRANPASISSLPPTGWYLRARSAAWLGARRPRSPKSIVVTP